MSLHIESTEDALAELKKQRTKTLTAAISVSFLGVALMGLLLYLVHIIVAVPEDPPMVAYATQEGDNPDIDTPEVTQTTQRPSSSSTSAQVKVIAAVATADVAVVNPDIEVDVPSEELSMGIDIGDGFGTGTGDGDGGGIPGIISKRCDLNDRMKRITENGGTPQCEEAVVKSLRWLKTQQNGNGSPVLPGPLRNASFRGIRRKRPEGHLLPGRLGHEKPRPFGTARLEGNLL